MRFRWLLLKQADIAKKRQSVFVSLGEVKTLLFSLMMLSAVENGQSQEDLVRIDHNDWRREKSVEKRNLLNWTRSK